MRILTIVGARPQFIKAAAVSKALSEQQVNEVIVHSGQHYDPDMSDVFFRELKIPLPAYNLGIHGQSHGEMTGRMLAGVEEIILQERPDWVLVYGDTNSTLAGALAAAKLHIPVAHVEAGLRSFNKAMPEEINRLLSDHISNLLFCPTRISVANLANEGLVSGVHLVGDVMMDAAIAATEIARRKSTILGQLDLKEGQFSLATVHRAENTDVPEQLACVMRYLEERAKERPMVLPLHPRTRAALAKAQLTPSRVRVVGPIGYLDMQRLLGACAEVFTDSGGLQKEAYFHRKPCTTLRDETEWLETVSAGWNRLWRGPGYCPRVEIEEYGGGKASSRIADLMKSASVNNAH